MLLRALLLLLVLEELEELVVGRGPIQESLRVFCSSPGVRGRIHAAGVGLGGHGFKIPELRGSFVLVGALGRLAAVIGSYEPGLTSSQES